MKKILNRIIVSGLLMLAGTSYLFAEDLDLRLDVEGFIHPPPTWRDVNNNIIDHLSFRFSKLANLNERHLDVESDEQLVKITDTVDRLVSIQLIRPKKCFVGETQVDDNHVYLRHRAHKHVDDQNFKIPVDSIQIFRMGFDGAGGYSHLSGVVKCEIPGMLRYSYD